MPESRFPARSTPFPSHLLDTVMPVLKDTEWRVLCVVVRATLGWAEGAGGQRKPQDWLTQSQLKERTGRATEAISHAIERLVRQGLLEVRDETGRMLSTPQERRRCQGHLLFSLGPLALDASYQSIAESNGEKRRYLPGPEVEGKGGCSESEQDSAETELRKANTTKERIHKRKSTGRENTDTGGDKAVDKSVSASSTRWKREPRNTALSDVQRFLAAYSQMFALRSARGEPPPNCSEKDSKRVEALLAQYGYERLIELLERFFQSQDTWVRKRGYAFFCFPALLPQLLMERADREDARDSAQNAGTTRSAHTEAEWRPAGSIPPSRASLLERFPDLARHALRPPPQARERL